MSRYVLEISLVCTCLTALKHLSEAGSTFDTRMQLCGFGADLPVIIAWWHFPGPWLMYLLRKDRAAEADWHFFLLCFISRWTVTRRRFGYYVDKQDLHTGCKSNSVTILVVSVCLWQNTITQKQCTRVYFWQWALKALPPLATYLLQQGFTS